MEKDEFVGTWKLASFEMRRSDGQTVYPFGRDIIGVGCYDARGNMSGQLMRSNRPAFAINDPQKGTSEEIKAAFEGYLAYFGTYEIDEEKGTVTHHVKGSMFPNWVGSDQIRFYEFSGNRLTDCERASRCPVTNRGNRNAQVCALLQPMSFLDDFPVGILPNDLAVSKLDVISSTHLYSFT